MRNAFARAMTEIAAKRNDVCLLSGDIGNRMFDQYKEIAPTRFLNCGIAEANMMSVAAGMALSGLRPVVYTITPFTTTRCLEQIRTGVAYHEAPVVIVGTGSGLSYAELGATHHSLEDMAILRSIPNIQICAPADPQELVCQLKEALDSKKPTYIRIGKKGEPDIFKNKDAKLGIGKANHLVQGENILVMGIGPIINEALKAAEKLSQVGINIGVASMGSIKPLDTRFIEEAIEYGYNKFVTLEEHHRDGGLGTTVSEWITDHEVQNLKLKRIGTKDSFIHLLGPQEYVRENEQLNANQICNTIKKL